MLGTVLYGILSIMVTLAESPNIKDTGAYYTDPRVARYLSDWAIRSADDRVLDPSFGGGVFLQAASDRIVHHGGNPCVSVCGIEIDPVVHRDTVKRLGMVVSRKNLWRSDFFDFDSERFDAVVGNPPFVRYQAFGGEAREKALSRAAEQGVGLNKLSSSWAAFVVHGSSLLNYGGRLAMVLPMEMWHASYSLSVLNYLQQSFGRLEIITFRKRLFADISQDTVLLLADQYGRANSSFKLRDLDSVSDLALDGRSDESLAREVDLGPLVDGSRRLVEEFIPNEIRDLYREVVSHQRVRSLGSFAKVGIGYVSGNNKYFHLSESEKHDLDIPCEFLVRAICKGRALRGLRFTDTDWHDAANKDDAAYLLRIPAGMPLDQLPRKLVDYIGRGIELGVDQAYKCRVRKPWYSVPHIHVPDAFLTYMSGRFPSVSVNGGCFVSPNNLHTVRLLQDEDINAEQIAVGWLSSFSRLSVEIEGHSMGGGMLKLEPREASRVSIPLLQSVGSDLFEHLDQSVRVMSVWEVADQVDRLVCGELGISGADCKALQMAARQLMERRYSGGRVS